MESLAGDYTLKGRFDSGKTRTHYVLMPLQDHAHWSHYNRVIQGSNVALVEVVVENGYKMHDLQEGPSFDDDSQQECGGHVEPTMGTMDLDGQLTQERFHSSQVGCISNNFDVNEFKREEKEQEEEDRIGDIVSSDSNDSDDDQGGRYAMPTPVDAMPVPVHGMPLLVPTKVLYAMPA